MSAHSADVVLCVATDGGTIRKGTVYSISYRCDYGNDSVEEDTRDMFWTGAIDTWGKLTMRDVDKGPTLYLFPREIYSVEPYEGGE